MKRPRVGGNRPGAWPTTPHAHKGEQSISIKKPTLKPKATQCETLSVLPGSGEERAYRKAIFAHINDLLAIPREVCERWHDGLQRRLDRRKGDFTPADFRLLLLLNVVVTAHNMPDNAPRARRRAATNAA